MLSLKKLLNPAIHRAGIHRQISATQLVQVVADFLDAAILPDLRPMVKIISVKDGVLKINCKNSVVSHEVKMLEPGIFEALAAVDPKHDVKRIFIQLRSMDKYDF